MICEMKFPMKDHSRFGISNTFSISTNYMLIGNKLLPISHAKAASPSELPTERRIAVFAQVYQPGETNSVSW